MRPRYILDRIVAQKVSHIHDIIDQAKKRLDSVSMKALR